MDWRKITLPDTSTIKEALNALSRTRAQILLIIDRDSRFVGCVTDGDIRRQLLRNSDLNVPIREAVNISSVTAKVESLPSEKFKLLKNHNLVALPVLFENGRIHSVIHREDRHEFLSENFSAVIMAGGRGSRLGSLTQSIPKPLLEIGGKTLIERSIGHLAQEGFSEIFISVGYLANKVIDFLSSRKDLGVKLNFIREEIPLGTAGSLALLPKRVKKKPILVTNSDLVHDVSFLALAEFHLQKKSDLTVVLSNYRFTIPYGVFEVAKNQVKSFQEKPSFQYQIGAGITVLSPDTLGMIKPGTSLDMTDLLKSSLDSGRLVMSYVNEGLWIDVGNPNDFALSQLLISS